MGDEINPPFVTTRLAWRLVDLLSLSLDADERNAVRGDLTESGATARGALCDVLGLVVRRQAGLWLDWRPWLACLSVVVPLGLLLGHIVRWVADGSAIYAFLYFDRWSWVLLQNPGARRDLFEITARFSIFCAALIGWSWTSGFVLGSLSRRTLWINGILFCLIVVVSTFGTITTARVSALT